MNFAQVVVPQLQFAAAVVTPPAAGAHVPAADAATQEALLASPRPLLHGGAVWLHQAVPPAQAPPAGMVPVPPAHPPPAAMLQGGSVAALNLAGQAHAAPLQQTSQNNVQGMQQAANTSKGKGVAKRTAGGGIHQEGGGMGSNGDSGPPSGQSHWDEWPGILAEFKKCFLFF